MSKDTNKTETKVELKDPGTFKELSRAEIISKTIEAKNFRKYLEVGVEYSEVIDQVKAPIKVGVDPNVKQEPKSEFAKIHKITSDEFFDQTGANSKFDVIFIDGDHDFKQSLKDIKNAAKHVSKKGLIFVHDINPPTEWHTRDKAEVTWPDEWCGTVWRAYWTTVKKGGWKPVTFESPYGLGALIKDEDYKPEVDISVDDFSDIEKLYNHYKQDFDNWVQNI